MLPCDAVPDTTAAEEQRHRATQPLKVKASRPFTHNRQRLTEETLIDAMVAWLFQEVTMSFNLTREICEQARYQVLRSRTIPMIESKRFQNGSLTLVKNKTTPDTWFLRFYEDVGEKCVYRRQRIGTVRDYPLRRDAEKAVLTLRGKINNEVGSPETVNDLIAHYQKYELTPARKAFASIENHLTLSKCYITPRWGSYKLGAVRTVEVERWLDSLTLAPASKTKIKSAFSVLYSHAIRYEWLSLNPISKVRTSSKPLREKDVLTPEEFQALLK